MGRGLIKDEPWSVIVPFLPAERGRGCRPALENRTYVNGMLWILRSGAPWRDLPEEFGKWNSVFQRFRRWCQQGIFDAMLESGIADAWKVRMVNSTVIRGHSQAAGAQGGANIRDLVARGGFTSKIHCRADPIGRPVAFFVTPGQTSDSKHLQPLMEDPVAVPAPKYLLGDKG